MAGRPSAAFAWGLVVLLTLPTAAAVWTQAQGDATRNGVAALPGGALDVLEVTRLGGGGQTREVYTFATASAFAVGDGLLIMSDDTVGTCMLEIVRPEGAERLSDWRDCYFAHLFAIDAAGTTAFVCLNQNGLPRVEAIDLASGTPRWTHEWFGEICLGAAYDATLARILLPITIYQNGNSRARLDVLDAQTGEPVFQRFVPPPSPAAGALLGGAGASVADFARGVSATASGILLTGFTSAISPDLGTGQRVGHQEMFVAWFDREGTYRGREQATLGKTPDERDAAQGLSRAGTQWPPARGSLAALGIGDEVVVVQPETAAPVLRAPLTAVEPTTQGVFWRTGAWTDGAIILQLPHSLRAFEPATLAPSWTWSESLDHRVQDVMQLPGDRLLVLASSADETLLLEIDARSGKDLSRVRVPISLNGTVDAWATLVPADGQALYVVGDYGAVVRLGPSDPALRPAVQLSTRFPAPGQRVHLQASAPGAERLEVDWGDARFQPLPPSGVERVLAERGAFDVRVVATYPDGTTATTVVALDVGGTPPPDLNLMQKAFAPDNQDLTFGIVGVGLTLLGAAFTIGRTRARIARLERELDAMEEIRVLSARDPREAARTLRDYRAALPQEMARRRIDESHYHVLEARSARLLRVLRTRLFAPYAGRLSDRYQRLLEAAFDDATLGPAEWALLTEGLDAEPGLSDEERRDVRELLSDFVVRASR